MPPGGHQGTLQDGTGTRAHRNHRPGLHNSRIQSVRLGRDPQRGRRLPGGQNLQEGHRGGAVADRAVKVHRVHPQAREAQDGPQEQGYHSGRIRGTAGMQSWRE